eukprot:1125780-Rhodomonas_salina.4
MVSAKTSKGCLECTSSCRKIAGRLPKGRNTCERGTIAQGQIPDTGVGVEDGGRRRGDCQRKEEEHTHALAAETWGSH